MQRYGLKVRFPPDGAIGTETIVHPPVAAVVEGAGRVESVAKDRAVADVAGSCFPYDQPVIARVRHRSRLTNIANGGVDPSGDQRRRGDAGNEKGGEDRGHHARTRGHGNKQYRTAGETGERRVCLGEKRAGDSAGEQPAKHQPPAAAPRHPNAGPDIECRHRRCRVQKEHGVHGVDARLSNQIPEPDRHRCPAQQLDHQESESGAAPGNGGGLEPTPFLDAEPASRRHQNKSAEKGQRHGRQGRQGVVQGDRP